MQQVGGLIYEEGKESRTSLSLIRYALIGFGQEEKDLGDEKLTFLGRKKPRTYALDCMHAKQVACCSASLQRESSRRGVNKTLSLDHDTNDFPF
jgi:hypothetical protein